MSSRIKIRMKIGAQGSVSMQENTHLMATLGQKGIKVPDFIKDYNKQYPNMNKNITVSVIILLSVVKNKKTYEIISHKAPSVSELIKKHKEENTITEEKINLIAQEKMPDLNCSHIDQAKKIITGSVKSFNLIIIKEGK